MTIERDLEIRLHARVRVEFRLRDEAVVFFVCDEVDFVFDTAAFEDDAGLCFIALRLKQRPEKIFKRKTGGSERKKRPPQ